MPKEMKQPVLRHIDTLITDVRYGLRCLWKAPVFSLVAVLALALGIGANTAIFSLIDANIFHPLPFKDPSRIVQVWSTFDRLPKARRITLSAPEFAEVRTESRVFKQVAAFEERSSRFTGYGEPEKVHIAAVSADLFPLLGVRPELGRLFTRDDERPDAALTVLLSHSLWEQRFSLGRNIVGRAIVLDNKFYTIVGVLPRNFGFPDSTINFWTPYVIPPSELNEHSGHGIRVIARLKDGVSTNIAQSALAAGAAQLADQFPATDKGWHLHVEHYGRLPSSEIRLSLYILGGAVSLVLLIACADIAILLLTRILRRQEEIAVRRAFGATRTRIARQLLTESLLLAIMGATAGLVIAYWSVNLLRLPLPLDTMALSAAQINGRALIFTLTIAVLTAVLFGSLSAFPASGTDFNDALKCCDIHAASSTGFHRKQDFLVVSQIGLAFVLLVGSGLLIRSFVRLLNVKLGFDPSNILTIQLSLDSSKYPEKGSSRSTFLREILRGVGGLPGVTSDAVVSEMVLGPYNSVVVTPSMPSSSPVKSSMRAAFRVVSPNFFSLLRIPLLKGREFSAADDIDSPCVVVINKVLAQSAWPGQNPIGSAIESPFNTFTPMCQIIGMVSGTRDAALMQDAGPEMYFSYWQLPRSDYYLLVRSDRNLLGLATAVRQQIWAVDKDQPLSEVKSMDDIVASSLDAPRYRLLLLSAFSGLALALALMGVYGTMSYIVESRTHEIGVRIAIGASRSRILLMVFGRSLRLVSLGLFFGLVGALALTRFLSGLLFGITATDSVTYVVIILFITLAALLASYMPARRAMSVDPATALRYE